MKLKAFTLAEVLITLAIIGIVAALTIPSVISNYQQQEFKTGLKKAVSVLNEAIQTNIASDGETPYENADLFNYIQRHMSILKSAKEGETWEDGIKSVTNNVFYTTDGMRFEILHLGNAYSNNYNDFTLHESGIKIADGSAQIVSIGNGYGPPKGISYTISGLYPGACGSYGLSRNPNNTTNTPCIILVDVNGDKKPSRFASNREAENAYKWSSPNDKKITDLFNIMITDEKAIPFGVVAQRAMYSK